MPKYANGKIYIIRNTENDKVYIGSTTRLLCQRFAEHRSHMQQLQSYKLYHEMQRIGKDKFYIELIKAVSCNTKEELNAEEGKYIREYNTFGENGLNKQIAGNKFDMKIYMQQYNEKYRETNRSKLAQHKKQDYEHNKQRILEKRKSRVNCPHCDLELCHGALNRHIKTKHIFN